MIGACPHTDAERILILYLSFQVCRLSFSISPPRSFGTLAAGRWELFRASIPDERWNRLEHFCSIAPGYDKRAPLSRRSSILQQPGFGQTPSAGFAVPQIVATLFPRMTRSCVDSSIRDSPLHPGDQYRDSPRGAYTSVHAEPRLKHRRQI
jgi:hypothetical protein